MWQRVYKKPRPKPSSHVDSLFIAPDGTKLKSLLSCGMTLKPCTLARADCVRFRFGSAQRHALQCDGQTVSHTQSQAALSQHRRRCTAHGGSGKRPSGPGPIAALGQDVYIVESLLA